MKSVYTFLTIVFLCSFAFGGTVAHYNFDEGSDGYGKVGIVATGHTVEDVVGSYDATVSTASSVGPKYTEAFAKSGSVLSMQFGPQTESVHIANCGAWNFGSAKTIEMYVRIEGPTSDPSGLQIIFAKDYTGNNGYICYWDQAYDRVTTIIGSLTLQGSSNVGLGDGAWHHIALTSDGQGEYDFYIDRSLDSYGSGNSSYVSNGHVTIGGGYGWMEARVLNGSIDEVKVSDEALDVSSFQALPPQMVGCYNFEEGSDGSGSTGIAPTSTGHVDNICGDYDATVTVSSVQGPSYIADSKAQFSELSLQFSSANEELQVANSAIWNLGSAKTIEFFMKVDGGNLDSSTQNHIICKDYTTNNGYSIYWDEATRSIIANIAGNVMYGAAVVDDGLWHHVAVTSDNAGNYKLYVDYVMEDSVTGNNAYISNGYVTIGRGYGWQSSRSFYGVLDDIRVFDSALTPENFRIPECDDQLLAFYRFEAGAEGYIPIDGSAVREYNTPANQSNYGTFNNADEQIVYTEDVLGIIESRTAIEFGSSDDYISIPDGVVTDFDGPKTIEMFLRVDAASTDASTKNFILSKSFPASGGYELFWDDSSGLLKFSISSGTITSVRKINDGYWHHVAITSDGNGVWKLYVDYRCQEILTDAQTATTDNSPLYIGTGCSWQNLRYFVGAIDELRVSRQELDAQDFMNVPSGYVDLIDKFDTLNGLADQLESQDELDVYAAMRMALIDKYLDYYIEDIFDQVPNLPTYAYSDIDELLDEEIVRLQGIISDTYSVVDSPRRVVSQMPSPVDGHLEQQVRWSDGSTETRPIFLYGFDAEQQNFRKDAFFLGTQLGCNYLQLFTGPKYVMPLETMWNENDPSQSTLDSSVMWHYRSAVSDANDNGIVTDFNICPHWIQNWFIVNNPQYYSDLGGFLKYTLNQSEVKDIIGWTCRLMIEDMSTVPGLWSCTIMNEPCFFNWNTDPDTSGLWVDYLKVFYNNDIANANANWNTSYSSWTSIPKYLYPPSTPFGAYPVLYDWMNFNDQRISDWASWLKGYVKAGNSNIYTHIKQNERFYSQFNVMQGSDIDALSRVTDMPGTDVALFPWDTSDSLNIQRHSVCSTMSLSIQKTLTGMPVINSEDHVIFDHNTAAVADGHVRSALWLQALNGTDAAASWIWGKDRDNLTSDLVGLWMYRPGAMEEFIRTGMDLMRLMPQVVQFRDKPSVAAVLYSRTSALRDPDYYGCLFDTFQAMQQSGVQTVAITEQMIENDELLSSIPGLKVLILPGSTYLPEAVYDGIVDMSSQYGIRVIGIGSDIAAKEEYCFTRSNPFGSIGDNYQQFTYANFSGLWTQLVSTLTGINITPQIRLIDEYRDPLMGLVYKSVVVDSVPYLTAVNISTSSKTFKAQDVAYCNWVMNDELNLVPDSSSSSMTLSPLEVGYYRLTSPSVEVSSYCNFDEGCDDFGTIGTAPSTTGWIKDTIGSRNGTATVASGKPEYVSGIYDDTLAMLFGNSNNCITYSNATEFNWQEGQSKTIEFFIRRDGNGPDQSATEFIMCKGYASSGGWQINFDRTTAALKFNIQGQIITSTTTFDDQQWHHVAIRHEANSGKYQLLVDYTQEAELTGFTSGSTTTAEFLVGKGYGWQNLRVFNGALDNIRISAQYLSQDDFLDD